MPLTLQERYDVAMSAISTGDIDQLSKVFVDPQSVTVDEQRSMAARLGLRGGFLSAAVNTAADPLVWVAFLMSRRFPTHAWLKGVIPHRFIGAANEFSGISLAIKPTESLFRGTSIPKLLSLSQHRQAKVMKIAEEQIFNVIRHRPNWKNEMPIISQALEGMNPPGLTPDLVKVKDKIRSGMEEMWTLLKQAKKIEGGLDFGVHGARATARDFTAAEAPRYLRDYLPHIPLQGPESTMELSGRAALERLGGRRNRTVRQMLKMQQQEVEDVWTMTAQGGLISDFNRFQRWAASVGSEVYNPHLFRRIRHGLQLQSPKGQELFVTDLNLVLEKYASSVARTYAVNAPLSPHERAIASSLIEGPTGAVQRLMPTEEPIMVQVINEGLDAARVQYSQRPIRGTNRIVEQVVPGTGSMPMIKGLNTLVRSVRGASSEDEIYFGQLFNQVYGKLEGLRGRFSGRQINQLTEGVGTVQRNREYRRKADAITNYLYATTLGFNISSSFKNLFQPLITTGPAIGLGHTIAGIKEYAPRVRAMFSGLAAEMRALPPQFKGARRAIESMNQQFRRHFPELVSQRLDIDPRLFDISEEALSRAITPDGKFLDRDAFYQILMAPFKASEFSNRAVTFYGAKNALRHLIRTGEYPLPMKPTGSKLGAVELEELLNFEAANVVNATQFRPGPGSKSVLQSLLPGPLRQFSTFPLRLLNFNVESTVRGAMTQAQLQESRNLGRILGDPIGGVSAMLGGRNLGTLARVFLYSKIAAHGFREVLGVDPGGALGLLLPFESGPSVLPIPPLPSMVYGSIQAFANQDIRKLQPMELPGGMKLPIPKTLFPAGVATSRLFRAWNQWRPDLGGFVDQHERLKFQGDTPDLILSAMGLPSEKYRRERQILERLQDNRWRIREMRREFMLAATRYDFREMDRVRAKYAKRFPDMPRLSVSKRDLDRWNSSRRLTRVQRMLDTHPSSWRMMEEPVIYDIDTDLIAPRQPRGLAGLLAG